MSYSKKILEILGKKPAVSVEEIEKKITPSSLLPLIKGEAGKGSRRGGIQSKYAITRCLKNLKDAGFIEQISSPQNEYARLTKEGKKKMHSLELDNDTSLVNTSWDGLWRIILLDLPENRKGERESLRYLLKKAGFVCLKNSAWISPFPFEHLFANIKKDLNLTTEMMIIVTENIDEESKKVLFETFGTR
jgi:DNA-binding transcriptional regulator PaaX